MNLKPEEIIKKLQDKPYETRVKILWSAVAVVGVVLIILWVFSLKNTISGLNGKSLIQPDTQQTKTTAAQTRLNLIVAERVEKTANTFKIYFNINNQTDDILNFSAKESISLTAQGKTFTPSQMLDRQNKPFVAKILSHTQNFGILVFPMNSDIKGTLTFDQMSFEKTTDAAFSQELTLDFKTLETQNDLRN